LEGKEGHVENKLSRPWQNEPGALFSMRLGGEKNDAGKGGGGGDQKDLSVEKAPKEEGVRKGILYMRKSACMKRS